MTDKKPHAIKKELVLPALGKKIDEITLRKQSMHKLKCISLSASAAGGCRRTLLKMGTDEGRMELGSLGVCCAVNVASQPMLQAGFGSQ